MARTPAPKTTVIKDDDLDAPQSTSAGDAPADTYDPNERVTSARPNKAAAAADGHQTVNAVEHVADIVVTAPSGTRNEAYPAYQADGTQVTVLRSVITGSTQIIPAWVKTTDYALDDIVALGKGAIKATTAGKSGSTAPSLPAAVGGNIASDGTAAWTRVA